MCWHIPRAAREARERRIALEREIAHAMEMATFTWFDPAERSAGAARETIGVCGYDEDDFELEHNDQTTGAELPWALLKAVHDYRYAVATGRIVSRP